MNSFTTSTCNEPVTPAGVKPNASPYTPSHWFQWITVVLAGYAIVVGLTVLAGWIFQVERLTDWTNDGISMFPNTAIGAICLGIALIVALSNSTHWTRYSAILSAGFAGLIGGATFFEHLSGINLGIDTLFFEPTFGQRAATSPLRMGPPASVSYLALGIAVMLTLHHAPGRRLAVWISIGTLFISLLSFTGYCRNSPLAWLAADTGRGAGILRLAVWNRAAHDLRDRAVCRTDLLHRAKHQLASINRAIRAR
jgi:hypothetical protein